MENSWTEIKYRSIARKRHLGQGSDYLFGGAWSERIPHFCMRLFLMGEHGSYMREPLLRGISLRRGAKAYQKNQREAEAFHARIHDILF